MFKLRQRLEKMTADEIINMMNFYEAKIEDIGEYIVDCAVDYAIWERNDEGLPPLTDDELKKIETQCKKNAAKVLKIQDKIDACKTEYCNRYGALPHFYEGSQRWARSYWEAKK